MAQPEPGRQLLKAAAGGPSRDSLVTVRARSRRAGRAAAGRFPVPVSRIKIQGPPGGCWCHPARQAGINECLDRGRESRMGGDQRGQDADPAVHAVRVRDVLQLDGLRALLSALRTCRNE